MALASLSSADKSTTAVVVAVVDEDEVEACGVRCSGCFFMSKMVHASARKLIPWTSKCFDKLLVLPFLVKITLSQMLQLAFEPFDLQKCSQTFDFFSIFLKILDDTQTKVECLCLSKVANKMGEGPSGQNANSLDKVERITLRFKETLKVYMRICLKPRYRHVELTENYSFDTTTIRSFSVGTK